MTAPALQPTFSDATTRAYVRLGTVPLYPILDCLGSGTEGAFEQFPILERRRQKFAYSIHSEPLDPAAPKRSGQHDLVHVIRLSGRITPGLVTENHFKPGNVFENEFAFGKHLPAITAEFTPSLHFANIRPSVVALGYVGSQEEQAMVRLCDLFPERDDIFPHKGGSERFFPIRYSPLHVLFHLANLVGESVLSQDPQEPLALINRGGVYEAARPVPADDAVMKWIGPQKRFDPATLVNQEQLYRSLTGQAPLSDTRIRELCGMVNDDLAIRRLRKEQ